jgi:hypothetical protein
MTASAQNTQSANNEARANDTRTIGRQPLVDVVRTVAVALWPTTSVPNGGRSRKRGSTTLTGKTPEGAKRQVDLGWAIREVVEFGLWPTATATASDHKSRSASQATLDRNARPLREIVFAMWSALRASDGEKGGPSMSFGAGGSPLPSQALTVANISNAPMENGAGSLHPEFAGWELGYPPAWLNCAPSAMPSTRGPRARS